METATTTAFSYIRFSNLEQAAGDSLRRQTERASEYSGRRGWKLDDTLTLRDLGVSAFRGMNATVGNLRVFLDAIKSGKVVPGSALIVESFDRISRQGIDEGYDLVKSILKAGVKIVTLSPEREFDLDATKSLSRGALEIQLILERAAEESERKSERVGAAWAKKQREAGQKAVTRRVPVWIVTVGGEGKKIKDTAPGEVRYALDPEKVAIVHRIFREAAAGAGAFAIARKLNEDGVPYIGRKLMKGKRVAWNRTIVHQILTSRATVGDYTPYRCRTSGRKDRGEAVPNYFPGAIDEGTYYQAQTALATRAKVGRGRRGKHINLLSGLLVDARGGGPMTYSHRAHNPIVIPQHAVESGNARWVSFSSHCLETAVLLKMRELTAKDVTDDNTDTAKRQQDADAQIVRCDALRAAWREKMDDVRIIDTVAAKLAELEGERQEAVEAREAARREAATSAGDSLGELNTLADVLAKDNSDETRLKVRSALRAVVESVALLVLSARKGERTRYAAARVQFRNGRHRDYLIITRHPRSQQHPALTVESFADAGLPGAADLRDPKQAAKLEALLMKHVKAK